VCYSVLQCVTVCYSVYCSTAYVYPCSQNIDILNTLHANYLLIILVYISQDDTHESGA